MNELGKAGCTDALVSLGIAGQVRFEFFREALSAEAASLSATNDVRLALPEAKLVETGPDSPA